VGWWGGGWLPTHFKVKHQLQLRLSWAVTIYYASHFESGYRHLYPPLEGGKCDNIS
jgi:hypothetical protein